MPSPRSITVVRVTTGEELRSLTATGNEGARFRFSDPMPKTDFPAPSRNVEGTDPVPTLPDVEP